MPCHSKYVYEYGCILLLYTGSVRVWRETCKVVSGSMTRVLTSLGKMTYEPIAIRMTAQAVMKYPNALSLILEPPERERERETGLHCFLITPNILIRSSDVNIMLKHKHSHHSLFS